MSHRREKHLPTVGKLLLDFEGDDFLRAPVLLKIIGDIYNRRQFCICGEA